MKSRAIFITVFAIGLGFIAGFLVQPVISGDGVYTQLKKFDFVLNNILKNYVDEEDPQKLVEAAIKGMLNELDPHSVFIPAEQMKGVKEDFEGSFEGIGVEFDVESDTITVVTTISGGPSAKLGVASGDKIVKINGENAVGMQREDVPKKLRGPKGSHVKISVKRANESELIDFDIERDKIPIYSVDGAFMINGSDIGYISVNRFAETTHREVAEAIEKLKAQGMNKLILDLRSNGGGLLDQAFMIADEFIDANKTIVYTKGRKEEFNEKYISNPGGIFEKSPLVVLINSGSASASEILSGSIQDLDRGLIVGETSFGKGLVQRQYELGDGSAYRLTIARYYTPSGRCIQRPYNDKEKYRELAGRLDLSEGANISHELEKISKEKGKDSIPIYRTLSGRAVLGGGGITPDYIVKSDTITVLSRNLRYKNLFFELTTQYLNEKGSALKSKYSSNFKEFLNDYSVSDEMIHQLKQMAEKKSVKWNSEDYKKDEEFIKLSIKSNIALAIWGNNESLQVFSKLDKQIQKAVELMPEAVKMLRH